MLKPSLTFLLAGCLALPGLARAADPADAALVKRGEYLAVAGDCMACHTVKGGKP
ncbi:cytochrome c, partial [Burkholderia pyrrocinia]